MHSKLDILWLSALACNGNAHSFLNYKDIDLFLQEFDFVYHPLLPSKYKLTDIANFKAECNILIIEGSIKKHHKIADTYLDEVISYYASMAKVIITLGTCASFGGIFAQHSQNISGLHYKQKEKLKNYSSFYNKTITLSGCPVHPETLVGTLYMIRDGTSLPMDEYNRPLYFYGYLVHNGCSRNEYFEYKIDKHNFGEAEGCSFYEHGCQGTYTHAPCNINLWSGVNSKTRAGQPCMGCSEPDFPAKNLWETKKHMGIPAKLPYKIPKRAYLSLAGVAKTFTIERFSKRIFESDEKKDRVD